MLAAIAGGVGAARLLSGLAAVLPRDEIRAIVNTGDDTVVHGLHVSPDLDTVTYTLAGAVEPATGWGLAGETWNALDALARYGVETWFRLGDRDLATHLYRTERLSQGAPLSKVTAEITSAWGLETLLMPMSDDPVRTRLVLEDGRDVAFQDYFVRLRHSVAVRSVRYEGAGCARPAPGVLEAIASADLIVICPSNPILSIAPVLAVPGVEDALRGCRDRVVGVSPIVAGAALKGPADRLLRELGHASTVGGVARLWRGFISGLVVDEADAHLSADVEAQGVACIVGSTVMSTTERAASLGRLVASLAPGRTTLPSW